MPMHGELLVKNHEGTLLEGERENKSCLISEFNHEVYRPYDVEENKLQGFRRLTAFTVVKDINKLTPQLYEIACKGRNCKEIEVTLYRTAKDTGDEEPYFKYILEDAKIISVENFMPSTKYAETENIGHLEKIKFLAKSFKWMYLQGGVEYTEVAV